MKPTQQQHPWRAALRTAVEVGIPAFLSLGLILPLILQELASGPLVEYLPESWVAWMLGAAAFITALAAALARVAAIPGVVDWTRKHLSFLAPDTVPAQAQAAELLTDDYQGKHVAVPILYDTAEIPVGQVVRGYVAYSDGSDSSVERWVRRADGAFVSLDSGRGPEWFDAEAADRFVQVI